jgi:phosphoribosylglycinamide formyltransferase 1
VARLAVLASGNGSNFQALVEDTCREDTRREDTRHECVLLIYDRKAAYVAERAKRLGIPARYISYYKRDIHDAEGEIAAALEGAGAELVALAGFMRILTPSFVGLWSGRIVNVHPALLPKWPGAHAIERAYEAGEREFGVTVHVVDEGMDTGPIITSAGFATEPGSSLKDVEARIHAIEHDIYPRAVLGLLDAIDTERGIR